MLIFVSGVLIFFGFFFLGTFIMGSFYLYEDDEDDEEAEIYIDQYGTDYMRYNIDDLESALFRIKRLEGIDNWEKEF